MGALIFFWLLFSAGVLLAAVGGRGPSLAERVQALRPEAPPASPAVAPAERVFDAKLLQPLSPPFLAVGAWVGAARGSASSSPPRSSTPWSGWCCPACWPPWA